MASTTFLMPTKTRSGATGKTPQKITTYDLVEPVMKKKLRKMVLPEVDDEKEEDEEPFFQENQSYERRGKTDSICSAQSGYGKALYC